MNGFYAPLYKTRKPPRNFPGGLKVRASTESSPSNHPHVTSTAISVDPQEKASESVLQSIWYREASKELLRPTDYACRSPALNPFLVNVRVDILMLVFLSSVVVAKEGFEPFELRSTTLWSRQIHAHVSTLCQLSEYQVNTPRF